MLANPTLSSLSLREYAGGELRFRAIENPDDAHVSDLLTVATTIFKRHPAFCLSFQPFQMGVLELVVASQGESAADAIGGDKLLEQRSGELDILAGRATGHDVTGGSAIIFQILIGREAKMKLVSFHGIIVLPAKPKAGPKARIAAPYRARRCDGN